MSSVVEIPRSDKARNNDFVPKRTGFIIREWKPYSKNTLKAFLALELLSGLIIRDCTYHEKNSSRWVNLPAREYEKPEGGKSWMPLIEFASKEARERFQSAAQAAVDRYLAEEEL